MDGDVLKKQQTTVKVFVSPALRFFLGLGKRGKKKRKEKIVLCV